MAMKGTLWIYLPRIVLAPVILPIVVLRFLFAK